MLKRPHEHIDDVQLIQQARKSAKLTAADGNHKQHTLDSDEEDEDESEDKYNVLDEEDIEGEETSTTLPPSSDSVRMTAFNMSEELEMGHFDREGHFIWSNEKEVRDNWLDNVDWQGIDRSEEIVKGLADESSDEESEESHFDEMQTYRKILAFLQPGETINRALKRLGAGSGRMSSMERLRRKREGTLEESSHVTKLTELANAILTETGNMDVYQESFELISRRIERKMKKDVKEDALDMYADDFDEREKVKLNANDKEDEKKGEESNRLMWEYKSNVDDDHVHGPFDTQHMVKLTAEASPKKAIWVRKCNAADAKFYSSGRIDFELYL